MLSHFHLLFCGQFKSINATVEIMFENAGSNQKHLQMSLRMIHPLDVKNPENKD